MTRRFIFGIMFSQWILMIHVSYESRKHLIVSFVVACRSQVMCFSILANMICCCCCIIMILIRKISDFFEKKYMLSIVTDNISANKADGTTNRSYFIHHKRIQFFQIISFRGILGKNLYGFWDEYKWESILLKTNRSHFLSKHRVGWSHFCIELTFKLVRLCAWDRVSIPWIIVNLDAVFKLLWQQPFEHFHLNLLNII